MKGESPMATFEREWLGSLSKKEQPEARKAITAGRVWAKSGQSNDALKAVLKFAQVSYCYSGDYLTGGPNGLWDSNHDAAYDHYHMADGRGGW
jgi:hypothetical protein